MAKTRLVSCLVLCSLISGCVPVMLAGTATTIAVVNDRRTAGTVIDDQTIEFKALHDIAPEPFYQNSHINFASFNGQLLLTGEVPNTAAKQQCEDKVKNIDKVRKVYNELRIGETTSLASRTQDSWITSKVKSQLLTDRIVSQTRIKVVTENGVVYLMGIVTEKEAEIATKLTQKVSGIKKITRIFEYVSTSPNATALGNEENKEPGNGIELGHAGAVEKGVELGRPGQSGYNVEKWTGQDQ